MHFLAIFEDSDTLFVKIRLKSPENSQLFQDTYPWHPFDFISSRI